MHENNTNYDVHLRQHSPSDLSILWTSPVLGVATVRHYLFSVLDTLYVCKTGHREGELLVNGIHTFDPASKTFELVKEMSNEELSTRFEEDYTSVSVGQSYLISSIIPSDNVDYCMPDFVEDETDYNIYALNVYLRLSKIRPDGTTAWDKLAFGETEGMWDEHACGLAVDSLGNVYAAAGERYECKKFSSEGQEEWLVYNSSYVFTDLAIAEDGNLLAGTKAMSEADPAVLLKLNQSNGSELWKNSTDFGNDSNDKIMRIQDDSSSNIYVCFWDNDPGEMILIKLDGAGQLISSITLDVVDEVDPSNNFKVNRDLETWPGFGLIAPMKVYNNSIYVGGWGSSESAECPQYRIYNCSDLAETKRVNIVNGSYEQIWSIDINSLGDVFVFTRDPFSVDDQYCNLFKFDSNGVELCRNESPRTWDNLAHMAVAEDGDVFTLLESEYGEVIRWHGSDLKQYSNWVGLSTQTYCGRMIVGK